MGVLQPDVYCLLQQQLLVGPGLIYHCGLLPLDWMVVLPCMLCKGRLLQCPLLACIPVLALTLAYLRPEEGQSIWSKRRQGFQPCCEAGIRRTTLSHATHHL